MTEIIDESVSVNLLSNGIKQNASPTSLFWHGRRYQISKIGFHHTTREGRILIHVFSVTDGVNFFKLRLDTETLLWKLLEVENG